MAIVLSVFAILPLATLLSHATESVAARTGNAVGGLLNTTLGNLTELVIALAALHAGQYVLVKASVAGAIVANTLFMLGESFSLVASSIMCRNSIARVLAIRQGCYLWPQLHY